MSPLLAGFTWLLLFQCAGEALAYFFDLPIPGPVLGMALLFAALLVATRSAGGAGQRGRGARQAPVAAVRSRRRRRDAARRARRRRVAADRRRAAGEHGAGDRRHRAHFHVAGAACRTRFREAPKHERAAVLRAVGLPVGDAAGRTHADAGRLCRRLVVLCADRHASAGQSGADRRRADRRRARRHPDGLQDLLRRRAVRALPARPGGRRTGGAAGPRVGQRAPAGRADRRRAGRRVAGGADQRGGTRLAVRRVAGDAAVAGAEIGHRAGGDGHRRETRADCRRWPRCSR